MESSKPSGPGACDRNAVLQQVASVVAEQLGIAPEEISEGDSLIDDIGCDSLDVVEISMELEDHFNISVPDEFADNARTVGDVADGILSLLASGLCSQLPNRNEKRSPSVTEKRM